MTSDNASKLSSLRQHCVIYMLLASALLASSPSQLAFALTQPLTTVNEPITTITDAGWETTAPLTTVPVTTAPLTTAPLPTALVTTAPLTTATTGTEAVTTTESPIIEQNVTYVVTSCSRDVILPPAHNRSFPTTLVLEFSEAELGTSVTCSWRIPAPAQDSSHVFDLHRTYSATSCKTSYPSDVVQVLYEDSLFGQLPIADSCTVSPGWKVTGVNGWETLVKFTSTNLTETNITVGRYSSLAWSQSLCNNGSEDISMNDSSWGSVEFPGQGLLLPPLIECTWSFKSLHDNGEVGLAISPSLNDSTQYSNCGSTSLMQVVDDGVYTTNSVTFSPCHIPKNFHYTSFGRSASVTVMTGGGGMPGFAVSFRDVPISDLCPTSSLPLSALTDQTRYFKGVNLISGSETQRECSWTISAPSPGMVVKLVQMFTDDYHQKLECRSNDTATRADGQTLSMCDNEMFPYWSQNQTTTFRFKATKGSEGSRVVVEYTAVPTGECQGHPIVLSASSHAQNVTARGLPAESTSGNYDCRWLLRTNNSDLAVQATVRFSTKRYESCYFNGIKAYDGPFVKHTYLVPTCPDDDHRTEVFTSHGDAMLLRFDRRYTATVEISYLAVKQPTPPPTGGGKIVLGSPVLVLFGMVVAWTLCRR
ncbi:mucin-22-like isoform X2 [Littorina saxatilis]|uniref:mucin-22-like isoform X2 n=1 Tax=Littorina saxatilis TaxID=31220 RepID=UPI0038B4D670